MVPLVVGVYAGKYIFKFHPVINLGACAGARSTTAALGALQEAAKSPVPAIGYTIPYAVGRIVLALRRDHRPADEVKERSERRSST